MMWDWLIGIGAFITMVALTIYYMDKEKQREAKAQEAFEEAMREMSAKIKQEREAALMENQ